MAKNHALHSVALGLPKSPGVYQFLDEKAYPLYIGKSINLKQRVSSYFRSQHPERKVAAMLSAAVAIRAIDCASDMSAQFLESDLIKQTLPLYNRRLRRKNAVVILRRQCDARGYINLVTVRAHSHAVLEGDAPLYSDDVVGVYRSERSIERLLEEVKKICGLCDYKINISPSAGGVRVLKALESKPCFAAQLKWCSGACVGDETPAMYNQRVQAAIEQLVNHRWPWPGPVLMAEPLHPQARVPGNFYLIHRWAVLTQAATRHGALACLEARQTPLLFDYDHFRILHAAVRAHPDAVEPL